MESSVARMSFHCLHLGVEQSQCPINSSRAQHLRTVVLPNSKAGPRFALAKVSGVRATARFSRTGTRHSSRNQLDFMELRYKGRDRTFAAQEKSLHLQPQARLCRFRISTIARQRLQNLLTGPLRRLNPRILVKGFPFKFNADESVVAGVKDNLQTF